MSKKDYHKTLGLSKIASADETKRAFRKATLTEGVLFAKVMVQHPVLAQASAGLFDGSRR
jgi:hypothetical protein